MATTKIRLAFVVLIATVLSLVWADLQHESRQKTSLREVPALRSQKCTYLAVLNLGSGDDKKSSQKKKNTTPSKYPKKTSIIIHPSMSKNTPKNPLANSIS